MTTKEKNKTYNSTDYRGLTDAARTVFRNVCETLDEREKADIAASFTGALIYTIVTRLEKLLCEKEKLPVVLAGGVAANSHLRRAVCDLCAGMGVECFIPPLSLCGDNAAMIASQGYYEFLAGVRAPLDQNAFATLGV